MVLVDEDKIGTLIEHRVEVLEVFGNVVGYCSLLRRFCIVITMIQNTLQRQFSPFTVIVIPLLDHASNKHS